MKTDNIIKSTFMRILIVTLFFSSFSCQKYLDQKPLKSLQIPNSLDDLQAILNNNSLYFQNSSLPEVLVDNYYVLESAWQAGTESQGKFLYIWDPKAQSKKTWDGIYKTIIYYSNVVLDKLSVLEKSENNSKTYDIIKGEALFYRALGFYQLAQLYCQPYSVNAKTDLGIPLRLTAAIESPSVRATVDQTYYQIIVDLNTALEILPAKTTFPTKPNKTAVYGALARCYLSMREYNLAGKYANLCLQEQSDLLDYNSIKSDAIPFKRFNPETIYYSYCSNSFTFIDVSRAKIDLLLYASYDSSDLRKSLFFTEIEGTDTYNFTGCYDGDYYSNGVFNGITTAELFLIRAECYARDNEKELALADLNSLMKNRWDNTVPYPVITTSTAEEALEKILIERRKELIFRGLYWSDIRRLNLEGRNITLERNVNGQKYILPPGDPRWVLLIPDDAINRSAMQQNPR